MIALRRLVFVAALAGLVAGLLVSAVQVFTTVPLIEAAEVYEHELASEHDHSEMSANDEHRAWAPSEGIERLLFTAIANVITATGFALIIVAAAELLWGGVPNWRVGLLWGLAGFAAVNLMPSLGLPPELPAMPAADLVSRQIWWLATVVATAGGLAIVGWTRRPLLLVCGLALIAIPHLVGAPVPEDPSTAVPEALHHEFVIASLFSAAVFWLTLGVCVGALGKSFAGAEQLSS